MVYHILGLLPREGVVGRLCETVIITRNLVLRLGIRTGN